MEKIVAAPHKRANLRSEQFGHPIDGERHESVLVGRARNGDRDAFDELVGRCDRYVLALALSASGDRGTARTVYVRAFVEAYRSLRLIPPGMSFRTWVYGIARQLTSDAQPGRQI